MALEWVTSKSNVDARIGTFHRYDLLANLRFQNLRGQSLLPKGPPLPGTIAGVVSVTGDPASQRVRVYRRSDGALVGETLSAEDGTYTITGLDPNETHYVVALHGTLQYNAVVADNITPEGGT